MPISDKDLGKYRRSGIYIEEIGASVVDLPFQDVLINFVPGFSKKGPVNRPIQITTKGDFIKIFGDIDKSLERKGSYFHRTCLKMLESSPIWALNLLATDDDRDKLNWKAVSLASQYDNGAIKEMPYSKIFNRQDFWKRDTDALLDYVTFDNSGDPDNNRLLYLTNVGDKVSTTFVYKSSAKGFDISLEEWYGGITKVPAYLHHKDWASDYLVTVVVLEGDWTNYNNLSVDTTWSKYFNKEGLIKNNISSFLNETNVTKLAYYDVSLIPYFKDQNDNVMYIKSVINNNTDKSGIFCAINEDYLLDSDIPTGSLDIIGSTLVGSDKSNINYLSYNENITENIIYPEVNLNSNGNTFGNSASLNDTYGTRKADTTDGFFDGINIISTGSTLIQVNQIVHSALTASYWLDVALGSDGNVPSGFGAQTGLNVNDPITFTASFDNIVAYKTYYVVNTSQGDHMLQISEIKGGNPLVFTRAYISSELSTAGLFLQKINVGVLISPSNYYNIDGGKYTLDSGSTFVNIEPLTLTINGTNVTPAERYDILYLTKGEKTNIGVIKGTQSQGEASKPSFNFNIKDYIILGYVKLKTEISGIVPVIPSIDTVVRVEYTPVSLSFGGVGTGKYINFSNIIITDGIVSGSNFIRFEFGGSSGTTDTTNYTQTRIRGAYDALEAGLSQGKGLIINRVTGKKLELKLSSMTFIDYGTTNNAVLTIQIGSEVASEYYIGSSFLFYYVDNEFVMNTNTDRLLTSDMPVSLLAGSGQTANAGVIGKYSALYLDFYNGIINNWDYVYVNNIENNPVKIYLKSWFKGTKLYIDFVSDTSGTSPLAIDNFTANYGSKLIVWSQKVNYKQTIEIESVDITKGFDNIFEISVDKTRFSEVTKGSFLEGYYVDEFGGTRKLVRVIKTTQDPNNANNKIVKTDGPIAITSFGGLDTSDIEYSTTMYPSMDVYVTTYKGIKLMPFKIHADSIPNKTDIRQSEILEVLNINKNLAKGLINKDKITWRYLIDSFGLGLTERSKQQLVDLCGAKMNCLGFISMPSIKDFKKSDNPMFIDSEGSIDTGLIKAGGDESKSPSYLYTFGDGDGATCVAYFIPYVTINDNGVPMDFPPASYAATTYMKKFNTNRAGIEPWTISAGISDGRVIGVGDIEIDFNDDQLTDMADMGANPLVKKKDVGICINSEYTAKRYPYSSLSVIHARELLIDLENKLYDMFLRYQWKFNTSEIRAEIKYKADKICKDLQERDGIYDFKNVIDETNNTNKIMELEIGVLDTHIEIIKGMGVLVNNITVQKKGSIQSGGFQ